jgi:hypothetical protein
MKITHRTCLVMLFVFASAGCALTSTQREATSRFAQASMEIGDFTSNEFSHFRSATIDMNTTSIAINGHAKADNLDGAFNPDDTIERVKAAQAISSYGKLLLSLVNDTQETELKQASNNFVDSFKSISNKKMTNSQLEGLGQLVQAIGSILVEAKKADAVKAIVPAAAKEVDKLCDLLINDLTPRTSTQLATGFDTTIRQLTQDADSILEKPDKSYTDRLIAVDGRRKAQEENDHLAQISSQAVKTLSALKAANAQLVNALNDDSLSIADIKTLGKEANTLKVAIDALTKGKYWLTGGRLNLN